MFLEFILKKSVDAHNTYIFLALKYYNSLWVFLGQKIGEI
jgi:hypothetical protein